MRAFLTDYVRTNTHNYSGRVTAKYPLFSETKESDEWFDLQRPVMDPELKSGTWYSILTDQGGSILVPEDDIVEVCDIPIDDQFENPWADFYFRDMSDQA